MEKTIKLKMKWVKDPNNYQWWLRVNDFNMGMVERNWNGGQKEYTAKYRDGQGSWRILSQHQYLYRAKGTVERRVAVSGR